MTWAWCSVSQRPRMRSSMWTPWRGSRAASRVSRLACCPGSSQASPKRWTLCGSSGWLIRRSLARAFTRRWSLPAGPLRPSPGAPSSVEPGGSTKRSGLWLRTSPGPSRPTGQPSAGPSRLSSNVWSRRPWCPSTCSRRCGRGSKPLWDQSSRASSRASGPSARSSWVWSLVM